MIPRPGLRHNVIANSMLASSFETYRLMSKPVARGASYIPGPLESQWRLGRRRMGFSLQCPPTPPPWAFTAPLDLSKWRWDPPKSLVDLFAPDLTHAPGTSLSFLAGSIKDSLGMRASSAQLAVDDTASAHLEEIEPLPTPTSPNQIAQFLEDVALFRTIAPEVDENTIIPLTEEISNKLYWHIFLGDLPPEDLPEAAEGIFKALDSRFVAMSDAADMESTKKAYQSQLLVPTSAIIRALSNSRVYPKDRLDTQFWFALGERFQLIPAGDDACNLLEPFISLVVHLTDTKIGRKTLLDIQLMRWMRKQFSLWAIPSTEVAYKQDARDDAMDWLRPKTSRMRQAWAIGRGLTVLMNSLGQKYRNRLVEKMTNWISGHLLRSPNVAENCELRYTWLATIAQVYSVGESDFIETACLLTAEKLNAPPLTGAEIGWLLLAQWHGRGLVGSCRLGGVYNYYREERRRFPDESAALTSFLKAVYDHNIIYTSPDSAVATYDVSEVPSREREEWSKTMVVLFQAETTTVWRLLTALGRVGDILVSLEAYTGPQNQGSVGKHFLENIAESGIGQYEAKIDIAELYNFELRRADADEFSPAVFEPVASKIVLSKDFPPDTIWRCLGLYSWMGKMLGFRGGFAEDRSHYSPFLYKVIRHRIIRRAATWFSRRPDLTYSQRYRHVYLCILLLKRRKDHRIPTSALKALYTVAVEDLKAGRWGRTRLLLHFCRLVGQTQGPEAERECRLAFSLWRRRLVRLQKLQEIDRHNRHVEEIQELETVVENTERTLMEKHCGISLGDTEAQETQQEEMWLAENQEVDEGDESWDLWPENVDNRWRP
ncbi:hypothetical protein QBC40DRAFT_276939 [Triangularia verruculosa]|uniref:Uncharacterized protein n=1 Tax=Triangularia verruculosa TaxID=2587418 RepID=A0AAN6XR29_9PEZI|nr:hypothetical protein QBC40DRAFT_276939 [Triangularia verruculosa]